MAQRKGAQRTLAMPCFQWVGRMGFVPGDGGGVCGMWGKESHSEGGLSAEEPTS